VEDLPHGTVTFLFTDIEGSTRLLRQVRDRYPALLADHQQLLRLAATAYGGREVDTHGDAFFFVFARAHDAVEAAVDAQLRLATHTWPDGADVRVRMGVHTGEPAHSGERYVGLSVHRAARVCAAANGGQILVSSVTRGLVEEDLTPELSLRDLGLRSLKDFDAPERLFEVEVSGQHRGSQPAREARADDTLTISVLGPVEATRAGRTVDLGTPQQRAFLALLAARAGQVVPVDAVVDALWPRQPPRSADKIVQTYASRLRKALGDETIGRRGAGYELRVPRPAVDAMRFEELAGAGRLEEALGLWRGPALADVRDDERLSAEADRLDELRLKVLEERIDADLAAGRHREVVAELRALVAAHPLRERLYSLLMLALYRSGRQAEALEAFREIRARLVDELGIEPSPLLRTLEASILRQSSELEAPSRVGAAVPVTSGSILVCRAGEEALEPALELAARLAEGREVIIADLVPPGVDVRAASRRMDEVRRAVKERGVAARAVAFTTSRPGADAARLARDHDAQLTLVPCPAALLADGIVPPSLEDAFAEAPCDVAVVAPRAAPANGPVAVPFGGAEHEWAAVELGAWLSRATRSPLQLVGSDASDDARDASRTLATASLLLQRHLGVSAEPVLAEPGPHGILAAVRHAGLVVAGLPDTIRNVGPARLALLRDAEPAVVLVRRGQRPGGLDPPGALTRFRWSRAAAHGG
jgi:DNA-binding SARP family transcriptional activator/class 3 adenylate cyclase